MNEMYKIFNLRQFTVVDVGSEASAMICHYEVLLFLFTHIFYFVLFYYVFDNGFIFIATPTTQGLCVPLGDLFYERYFILLVFQLLCFICTSSYAFRNCVLF